MAARSLDFKRLVLGLQPSAPDRAMRVAVELAGLLRLELLGLFLQDTSIHALAAIPFARELRLLGGGWQTLDLDRLSREQELAARSSERMFQQAASRLPTKCQFEVRRGATAAIIQSISRAGDIVMIPEPANPAERVAQQFSWLAEAAFRSDAAVMFVPSQLVRTSGPVVAFAAAPDDASIYAAAAVAIAAKEELVIVEVHQGVADNPALGEFAASAGLTLRRVAPSHARQSDAASLVHAIRTFQERCIVATRDTIAGGSATSIAALRRVPVLII